MIIIQFPTGEKMTAALPKLTALEKDVLEGIYASEYTDGGPRPNIWTWSMRPKICTEKQRSGVVSSLVKKGLVESSASGTDEAGIVVLELGEKVARALGIYKDYVEGEAAPQATAGPSNYEVKEILLDGTDRSRGIFDTLEEAKGCVWFDSLVNYEIWHGDTIVAEGEVA